MNPEALTKIEDDNLVPVPLMDLNHLLDSHSKRQGNSGRGVHAV